MPEVNTSFSPSVHYQKAGNGQVLVLLHGFPESSWLWQGIKDALAASYTLIMPDFPGSGKTSLNGTVSINDMAELVKAILDAEGITKAVVAGHSMGGYVALAFAHLYPEVVSGLSLIHSTPSADDADKLEMRKKAIDIINKGGKSAFIRQMVSGLFADGFKSNNAEVVESQIANALEVGEDGLVNYYKAMMQRADRTDVLDKAAFPVQWITGGLDNVIPFKKVLPYTHTAAINFVSFYPDCAHMGMYEAKENLIKDLLQFCRYCYNTI